MATRGRHGERREQLVTAAMAVIAQRGVGALRTREVAAAVGITHASLHYHFPNKIDLIRAVLERALHKQIVLPMVHVDEKLSAAERLRVLLVGLARQMRREPGNVAVLKELHQFADRDDAVRALLEPGIRRWREFLVTLIKQGQAEGDFRPDLDPSATASLLILVTLGTRLGGSLAPDLDSAVLGQIARLLGADTAWNRGET
ncbi:TetR/AcrR family transcriptional regulator [Kibdelosporangium persicum]|uniref:HTH tetR-type domain-containing protein n=1 Tax=Kibdelosporangium persicum TaxID=2698649 RepID=A0ABX2F8X8_9PSEU|nr:TetR/AcrR family transcriptional regulator [Kibdelosporangium persicum]NRN67381.1 hypothetical protein [Kibdelosporangium persicum]